jgi:hypothetical protein
MLTPDSSFLNSLDDVAVVLRWNRSYVAKILSGLTIAPEFHANGIRLDWLLRMVLSKSRGRREPNFKELEYALNGGLAKAGILHLEDPIEDLLCDSLATGAGNFRIFPGQWESATAFTQVAIEAFETLPSARRKDDTLNVVHALLRLSEEIAKRAGLDRTSESGGRPQGSITLPHSAALKRLARSVTFSPRDLAALEIDPSALAPFILDEAQLGLIGSREVGETPLEFHPLLAVGNELVVVSPGNVSLAVRAVIVNAVLQGGLGDLFHVRLLEAQERYAEATAFWPASYISLSPPDQDFLRASVCKYDSGRFLHVIQLPCAFSDFPAKGYMTTRYVTDVVNEKVKRDISRFWEFLASRQFVARSTTVLLTSGWGPPQIVHPRIDARTAPPHWQLIIMSFADTAILGACENGKFRDIQRMTQIEDSLLADGYNFMNPNGLINMFGFWRTTGGSIVPDNMPEMVPPAFLSLPTDALREPRREGTVRRDYRALPTPDGAFKRVQRMDWGKDALKPVFASVRDLEEGRLVGAFDYRGRTWWIETHRTARGSSDGTYRVWNGVMEWLAAVGPGIIERFPGAFPAHPARIVLEPPDDHLNRPIDQGTKVIDPHGAEVVSIEKRTDGVVAVLITEAWMPLLRSADNSAELLLAATILDGLAGVKNPGRAALRESVEEIISSEDWRWMHAREAITPLDRLAGRGLVENFTPVSFSALALAKVGSVWTFRDRALGLEITGEDECKQFLATYRDSLLASLIETIRQFGRQHLTRALLRAYQSARHEQSRWRTSIRALRAIDGAEADRRAFERQNEVNAVQRLTKALAEIAACEANPEGGRVPGEADLDEMYASAMLVIGNGQLFPVIRSGMIEARLKISPTGDLMSDRGTVQKLLEPSAVWTNAKSLDEAAAAYVSDRIDAKDDHPAQAWEGGLRAAIEAEYQITAQAYVDLPYLLGRIAEDRGKDVFFERLSAIEHLLHNFPDYSDRNVRPLLDRLTLRTRASWYDGLPEVERDLCRFDRSHSLISRPLLMVESGEDPLFLVAPALVMDAMMYAVSGLVTGHLNNAFWQSDAARRFAGERGKASGEEFERRVAERLNELGLSATPRCKLSAVLNQKVEAELGDIDVLAVKADHSAVWVIEAKNLRLCRTEPEVASRLSEYRGRTLVDSKGRERPDKLLRHLRRVEYLRANRQALQKQLRLEVLPKVKGLLVFDAPQPMNFYATEGVADAQSAFLDRIDRFAF